MTFETLWFNPWIWLSVSLCSLLACCYLPLRVRDERFRKILYRLILVPISLLLIFYVYPVGIELFRRFAVGL